MFLGAGTAAAEDSAQFKVCVQPMGKYEIKLVEVVARGAAYLYGVTVDTLEPIKMPKAAYYKPRKRWRAEKILDHLEDNVADGSGCNLVIGFTQEDISTTKDQYKDWGIFGLATLGGPTGVVSTHRLGKKTTRSKKAKRAVKVFNHELGHAFGAPHIPKRGCLMQDAAGTIKTVDSEAGLLCAGSRKLIEKKNAITLPVIERFDWNAVL